MRNGTFCDFHHGLTNAAIRLTQDVITVLSYQDIIVTRMVQHARRVRQSVPMGQRMASNCSKYSDLSCAALAVCGNGIREYEEEWYVMFTPFLTYFFSDDMGTSGGCNMTDCTIKANYFCSDNGSSCYPCGTSCGSGQRMASNCSKYLNITCAPVSICGNGEREYNEEWYDLGSVTLS